MPSLSGEVTAAVLIWLPNGCEPTSSSFRASAAAERLPSFGEAVQHALGKGASTHNGRPWILARSRIFDPEQIERARVTIAEIRARSPFQP